ncbi:MlaD family protein [Mycolicibacterium septicum]|uniref:MlaD family protein n=1 Tax=Mycolicibacterium septicum TaxID=98668 RepID=UPI002361B4A6|nr:Mammalian cell entry related domain protein [Mycolicibacterium septicum]
MIVGTALLLCIALVWTIMVFGPFGGRAQDVMSIQIDTPYVGQGVQSGTPLVMHGVKVGEVTGIASLPGGGVRLDADIRKKPTAELTDTMAVDFRPFNYFGVTDVNLRKGTGGQPLRDGARIKVEPAGNFTLQALLSRLGEISTGVLTAKLIQTIDVGTRYLDGLNPLLETALLVANAVTKTQTVSTAKLLANATGLSVAFPSAVYALSNFGDSVYHADENYLHIDIPGFKEENYQLMIKNLDEIADGIFGAVGKLLSSHMGDLIPVVDSIKVVSDVVPALIRPEAIGSMLVEMRTRLEKLYGGTPEQRALQVRILLDSLPGVAAPLGVVGVPQ